ncbi:MAG: M1 family metallopeptidase [Candidatus Obscuribacterales bacterium]|nr:M1 family metallopeptidase [Candidatus Obscuribacterales bacterium]
MKRLKAVTCSLIAAFALSPTLPESGQSKVATLSPTADSFRLPRSVTPESYTLSIDPDLEKGTFKGSESIVIDAAQTVNRIYLNSQGLAIESAELFFDNDKQSGKPAASVTFAKSEQVVTFILSKPVEAGKYKLNIAFSGRMNDKLCGFYKVKARDTEGHSFTLGATQMEPTDARRMFPCFDEPDFKASFKLKVTVDQGNTAISNSSVAREIRQKGSSKRIIEFAPTPKMSTYLVALLVGPFSSTPPVVANSIPIRVWAVKGSEKLGIFARNQAAKMMPYFLNYFAQPYAGTKLDLIAIPEFEAGAMENLGAITFREETLLIDEKNASVASQKRVSEVVAHEMAHLWFGDLVTMKWWDDLWLNEAFATWMAEKTVDFVRPDWQTWEFFTLDRLSVMETDELMSTRPIHCEVRNPLEAIEMFDGITYSKGASILRMLETYLGEKVFQAGVQNYMREHKFANATTADLWNSLQAVSQKPVSDIMYAWVHSPGFPVIEAQRKEDATTIRLAQSRFVMDAAARSKPENANALWAVPITWRLLNHEQADAGRLNFLLSSKTAPMVDLPKEQVPLLNAKAAGYYRVNYPENWLRSILAAGLDKLSVTERMSLLSDQWTLMYAGLSSVSSYFRLFDEYEKQDDPQLIEMRVECLDRLYGLLDAKSLPSFEKYVRNHLGATAAKFGWSSKPHESDLVRSARADVLLAMGTIGQDPQTIAHARKQFNAYLADPKKAEPDLLDPIFKIVAFNGDAKDYQKLDNLWRTAKTPEDRVRSMMSLPYFRKPELIDRALNFSLGNEIRLQDSPKLLANILSTPHGRQPGFKFIKDNFAVIKKRLPTPAVPHVVSSLESMCTVQDEKDLVQFLATNPIPAGRKRIQQALETVHNRASFRNRSLAALETALAGR